MQHAACYARNVVDGLLDLVELLLQLDGAELSVRTRVGNSPFGVLPRGFLQVLLVRLLLVTGCQLMCATVNTNIVTQLTGTLQSS